jgi:uncharacterized repeat protein (TIGR03803 family)
MEPYHDGQREANMKNKGITKKLAFIAVFAGIMMIASGSTETPGRGLIGPALVPDQKLQQTGNPSGLHLDYGSLPLYFTANRGQVDGRALFYAKAARYTLWLTEEGLVFDSFKSERAQAPAAGKEPSLQPEKREDRKYERDVSRLVFLNAAKHPEIVPMAETALKVNYFIGNDPAKWHTAVPTSEAVLYKNIYDRIDLKVYGLESRIEYDWIVRPGGDPRDIRFQYENVKGTRVDEAGNLLIETGFGELVHKKPVAYQEAGGRSGNGSRTAVESAFKKITDNAYGFEVGAYEAGQELVIDPVVLAYSTYLGGNFTDIGYGIAVDGSGNAYVTGYTNSTNFPTLNQYQIDPGDDANDVFVTKLDTTKSGNDSLVYSTYLGGSGDDRGYGIAVDGSGNAYVTGYTASTNFPTLNQYQTDPGDGDADVFVTKLDTTKIGPLSLVYSTYLGGSGDDRGYGIAVDGGGNVYVTGYAGGTNFPTLNQYQTDPGDGNYDAFVTKLDTTKIGPLSLVYSTYLGGSGVDYGYGIAVDGSGNAYVTGGTGSTNFPTLNQYQTDPGDAKWDAFVTKIDTTQSGNNSLAYSTYLGGISDDYGYGIAVDGSGNAYVTGETWSTDLPTLNQYQTDQGSVDVFVTKIDTTQSGNASLVYSTYLGGTSSDYGRGIAVDGSGNAYVTGETFSTNFPTLNQYQTDQADFDVFVTKLDTTKSGNNSLVYSTYLGGSGVDYGYGIAVDGSGNAYVTGPTGSTGFPTQNQYQLVQTIVDAFITKISADIPTVTTTAISSIATDSAASGGNVTSDNGSAVTARGVCWNATGAPTTADSKTIDGAGTGAFTSSITGLLPNVTYHVKAYATNAVGTAYGAEVDFTTLSLASVTTQAVSSIGLTTATGNGNITNLGNPSPTQYGVCWNTTGGPTVADSKTEEGAASSTGAFTTSMTGLTSNTAYHVKAYAANAVGPAYGAEEDFTTLASVTTTAVSSITATTASSGGNVAVVGGAAILARGVCWNTTGSPMTGDNKTTDAVGTGAYTSSIIGLTANTTYHVRAYVTNAGGTSYGNELDFTTATLATVTTTAVSNIAAISAVSGGNVTAEGGMSVTARGVCWSTALNPTTADPKTTDGSGAGAFVSVLTGLAANTTYNVRAYATNGVGTAYGNNESFTTAVQAASNLLHVFSGGPSDGAHPYGSLIAGGSKLYGMTYLGGPVDDCGLIFRVNADGTGYEILHTFSNVGPAALEGYRPQGSLLLDGSTLYGMTFWSGVLNNAGTLFKMNTDGSGYTVLHQFENTAVNGSGPRGTLILSGSTLYGMTLSGGSAGASHGTIFKIETNGTGFGLLHAFTELPWTDATDGASPYGALVAVGSALYGMTYEGMPLNIGVIFKINMNGTGYELLHTFAGGPGSTDGKRPYGSLIASGSTLYGMTENGGSADLGTIFKINTDGTGFGLLHSFVGGAADGSGPKGSLIMNGSTLYGMTMWSGAGGNNGTIFQINTDGTGFQLVHSFGGGVADGRYPQFGDLLLAGSQLYGMTCNGGPADLGVVFSQAISPSLTTTAVTSISYTTASSGGNVATDGGMSVTARGVCWSTSANPTIADSKTTDGAGTGVFTSSITGLTANTKHHVRAYATNAVGTSYGDDLTFTTLANVATAPVSSIATTTAQSGGDASVGGGEAISARGVCWNTTGSPTTANSKTTDGAGTGAYASLITGLAANTKCYVRAYATNAGGTSYGADVEFTTLASVTTTAVSSIATTTAQSGGNVSVDGGEAITERGVCWSTSANPTIALATRTSDGAATGVFTSNLTGLAANTTYHVRAFVTNAGGTSYGNEVNFTTSGPPTVTTQAVTDITTTAATGHGSITDFGSGASTQYGVCWNTTGNPTTADNKTAQGAALATGPFTSPITGLNPGTTYHVKAYATNNSGTAYGGEVDFTTVPVYAISGTVAEGARAIQWASITFSHDGHVEETDPNGRYAYAVPRGTTTTVTPSQARYGTWTPASRTITNITSDQSNQDFQGTPKMYRISGRVTDGTSPVAGVTITFSFYGHTETTAADGTYSYNVPPNSSTLITPSKTGYGSWIPAVRELTTITSDEPNQDFQGRNLAAPRMTLAQGQTTIPKCGTYDYGTQMVNAGSQAVFTITNTGHSDLTLDTNLVINGANADQFSVIAAPTSPVAPSRNTTFTIEFKATSGGPKTASIPLVNNDPGNNPYDLNLTGKGKTSLAFRYAGSWTGAGHGVDGWYIGDFNGDGKTDIFRYWGDSGADMFLSSGAQFVSSGNWTGAGHGVDGWYVGDFNGDGKTDIFRYWGASGADMFLSNGAQFVSSGSWTPAGHGTDGWYIGDFNGDGRSDICRVMPGSTDVFLSTGANFLYAGGWTAADPGTDGWYVGDFNGDGKSDIFRVGPGATEVFLSTGTSFVSAGSWTTSDPGEDGWYVGDFNGDGKTDIFRYGGASGADVFLSDGSAFAYSGSWTPAGHGPENWYVGNFDGTGGDDIFRSLPGVSGADVFLSNSALPTSVSESEPDHPALDEPLPSGTYREMSYAEETRLLAPFIARILRGEEASIFEIKTAYEGVLGRRVRKAAVNQLLSRHDFWKIIKGRAFGSPLARGLYARASTAEVDPQTKPVLIREANEDCKARGPCRRRPLRHFS